MKAMKRMTSALLALMLVLLCAPACSDAADSVYRVDLASEGVELSQELYGVFLEDINFSVDGGLYAELIQNRSFEFFPMATNNNSPRAHTYSWSTRGEGRITLHDTDGMNEKNPHWVRLTAAQPGDGLTNTGYAGIVLEKGETFGSSDMGKGKKICLDYSSINIAKRFGVGHLSTTMIGHSLKRIHDFLGYKTVGINHLGDWGTQFGKMIYAYKTWGTKEEVEEKGVTELLRLYVKFHDEAEKDPTLDDKGRAWFKKIEDGDEEALSIWNWFKDITLKDAARVYDLLGVEFDSYAGEAFYNDKMDVVIDELKEKGLLTISDGASVVDLEEDKMPPCIILRSDGATLYATRDLAAAVYRKNTYDFDKCLYVVAYQQDLHFRQLFKVLEKMGKPWAKDCVHVSFGMISFEGQAFSTRKGRVVYLEDVLNQAMQKALDIINEKSPNLPNKEEVARQVGIGAVIYSDLSNGRIKDIDFSFERALNFDGETGPYVQYTHARCCSVLRKAADANLPEVDYNGLNDDEAQHLLRLLSRFPDEPVVTITTPLRSVILPPLVRRPSV